MWLWRPGLLDVMMLRESLVLKGSPLKGSFVSL